RHLRDSHPCPTRRSSDLPFQETEQGVWITLKRVHLIIVIVIPIATMFAGAIGTYYKARADINDQIHSIQIQNTQTFAKQSDVKRSEEHTSELQSRENLVC